MRLHRPKFILRRRNNGDFVVLRMEESGSTLHHHNRPRMRVVAKDVITKNDSRYPLLVSSISRTVTSKAGNRERKIIRARDLGIPSSNHITASLKDLGKLKP